MSEPCGIYDPLIIGGMVNNSHSIHSYYYEWTIYIRTYVFVICDRKGGGSHEDAGGCR